MESGWVYIHAYGVSDIPLDVWNRSARLRKYGRTNYAREWCEKKYGAGLINPKKVLTASIFSI